MADWQREGCGQYEKQHKRKNSVDGTRRVCDKGVERSVRHVVDSVAVVVVDVVVLSFGILYLGVAGTVVAQGRSACILRI